ncbi:hypothetical protein EMCRGX_G024833 [Ephydatia muelleri]
MASSDEDRVRILAEAASDGRIDEIVKLFLSCDPYACRDALKVMTPYGAVGSGCPGQPSGQVDGAVMFHVTSVVLQLGLATLMWASAAGQYGWTSLMMAARGGHVECLQLLLDRGAQVNHQKKDGDTALHVAARGDADKRDPSIIDGWASCVRVLLSQPGIDINIKNNRGCTAMMDARYKSLGVLKQIVKTCNNFPADSYGKVVLCGDSGAGKNTLSQAIINLSKPTATQLVKRALRRHDVVEPLTAGIISHQVESSYTNMVIYDLAGHHQYLSSHSACLEAISLHSPAIFLLLQDLRKDSEAITKELYYWSTMINGVCHKCPQQSSIIIVGTHADLLTPEQVTTKLSLLQSVAERAISSHQKLVKVAALNVRNLYSGEMDQFWKLLHDTNKGIIKQGLIVYIPSEDPLHSWIVLNKGNILQKVNGALFADPSYKEYIHLASSTGIIPRSVLEAALPDYNIKMITQFMIHFELCQVVDLSQVNTNMAPEGSSSPDLGPLLYFPALVHVDRPSSATVPSNSLGWYMIVRTTNQFFTLRFLHVLLRRLPFDLPTMEGTPLHSHFSRSCDVWKNGVKWLNETGVTTIIEMDEVFQSLSLTMSSPDKTDPKYPELAHAVLAVIKKACQEFCPHVQVSEVISCPPDASSDHSDDTKVELSSLKKALLGGNKSIADMSGQKYVVLEEWMKVEPCLTYLVGVSISVVPVPTSPLESVVVGQVGTQMEEHRPYAS